MHIMARYGMPSSRFCQKRALSVIAVYNGDDNDDDSDDEDDANGSNVDDAPGDYENDDNNDMYQHRCASTTVMMSLM